MLVAPAAVHADELAVYDDIREHEAVDVHALLDAYIQHSFGTGALQFRAFDTTTDTPALGLLRLTLAHRPGALGFRIDAGLGDTADGYLHSDPEATDHHDLARGLSFVQQAFVTAVVPVGPGIAVDVGKFGTFVGLEDNDALANWSYSRSLLFTLPEPTYHTGLRATYAPSAAVTTQLLWVNGWNTNLFDGNRMRTAGGAVSWRPNDDLELVADYLGGLERAPTRLADSTLTWRHALDMYVTYRATDDVTLAASVDLGHDARTRGASWWGVAGYGRVRVVDWLFANARAEVFGDPEEFLTGTSQRLIAVTASVEARRVIRGVTTVGRLEWRHDHSDTLAFAGSRAQDTASLSLVLAF